MNDNVKMFEICLHELLPEFSHVLNNWGTKFVKSSLSINPKLLNVTYAYYTHKHRKLVRKNSRDFNAQVDILVENMPAPDSPS